MNLPNSMTSARILMSPIFFVLFFMPEWFNIDPIVPIVLLWLVLFGIELSDLLDGFFARRTGQTSETGKLLDPFADSLSRLTYFLCFTMADVMPVWIFVILLYRDLGVGFVRLLMSRKGVVMSARISGKLKAWIYAVSGLIGLLYYTIHIYAVESTADVVLYYGSYVCFLAAGIIALWSLADYVSVLIRKDYTKAD